MSTISWNVNFATADLAAGSLAFSARADQNVRVTGTGGEPASPLSGPPFNIPAGTVFDLSALGNLEFTWAAEVAGVAELTGFTAEFFETHPVLGPYRLANDGGPAPSFSGQLTNITESGGELVSADLSLNTTFSVEFLAPGLGNPLLYTKVEGLFEGQLVTGSNNGQVFTSSGEIQAFLDTGDPQNDPLAAASFNRTVTGVPEPTAGLLLVLLGAVRWKRSRRG